MSRRAAQRRTRKICRTLRGFVADGSEKVDELAKAGAMLDEGFMAEARAKTVQQEREEVYAAFAVCSQLSLFAGRMEGLCRAQAKAKRKVDFRGPEIEETKHRTGGVLKRTVSMYEMWKRQQAHEDAAEMHRTEVFV